MSLSKTRQKNSSNDKLGNRLIRSFSSVTANSSDPIGVSATKAKISHQQRAKSAERIPKKDLAYQGSLRARSELAITEQHYLSQSQQQQQPSLAKTNKSLSSSFRRLFRIGRRRKKDKLCDSDADSMTRTESSNGEYYSGRSRASLPGPVLLHPQRQARASVTRNGVSLSRSQSQRDHSLQLNERATDGGFF